MLSKIDQLTNMVQSLTQTVQTMATSQEDRAYCRRDYTPKRGQKLFSAQSYSNDESATLGCISWDMDLAHTA